MAPLMSMPATLLLGSVGDAQSVAAGDEAEELFLSRFLMVEFQKFLISLSVRPGSCAAIADHLRCHVKFSCQRQQEHDEQKTVHIHTEINKKNLRDAMQACKIVIVMPQRFDSVNVQCKVVSKHSQEK